MISELRSTVLGRSDWAEWRSYLWRPCWPLACAVSSLTFSEELHIFFFPYLFLFFFLPFSLSRLLSLSSLSSSKEDSVSSYRVSTSLLFFLKRTPRITFKKNWNRVFLSIPGWPWTYDPPAWISRAVGFQVCHHTQLSCLLLDVESDWLQISRFVGKAPLPLRGETS